MFMVLLEFGAVTLTLFP